MYATRSFCHALLEQFCVGLDDAWHTNEVSICMPSASIRSFDGLNLIDDSVLDDVLAHMNVEESLMGAAPNPLRRG